MKTFGLVSEHDTGVLRLLESLVVRNMPIHEVYHHLTKELLRSNSVSAE